MNPELPYIANLFLGGLLFFWVYSLGGLTIQLCLSDNDYDTKMVMLLWPVIVFSFIIIWSVSLFKGKNTASDFIEKVINDMKERMWK